MGNTNGDIDENNSGRMLIEENPTSYNLFVVCSNCDLAECINIPYGTLVRAYECPKCKCKTLNILKNNV